MENYDENDVDKTSKMIAKASEGLFTFMYLENSDQDKYGSIISNLNSQKSLGNDQYPRTSIVETNSVLNNHKFDIIKGKKPEQKHHNKSKPKEDKDDEEVTPLLFTQMEGKCYCCGKPGHKSPDCRSKEKIPREEWAINKSQQHVHKSNNDDAKSTGGSMITSKKEEAVVGWAGLHCSFAQTVNMKELILLDSDSTDTVFCNPKYVTNIRESKIPLSISTNGGELKSYKKCDIPHKKCDIPHVDNMWYNENSKKIIISTKDMTDKF
jgi:hypothetical protein